MKEWPDFDIPADWSLTRMDELAVKLKAGGTPNRKNKAFFGGDIPFVLIDDMTSSGVYLKSTKETITTEGLNSSSAWIVPENTVLLSMYATIGATVITTFPVATNQAILAIIASVDCDREYLAFCLQAHKAHLARLNVESTQKNINKGIVSSFLVPLPPLPEQKKIAYILSTVQRAIEEQERIIETTTELKKSLMQKLFTEGLRNEPQKQTEIGPVPESWEVVRIKDHCIDSAFGPRFGSELYAADGNILTLRTTDMEDDGRIDYNTAPLARIDYTKFEKHYLQIGDIVVSRSGTCGIASVFEGYSLPVLPGAFLIRLRMKESIQPMFLRHYINSPVGRPYVLQLAQGAIQKNISGTRLGELLIPRPSREEQAEISLAVGQIDQKLTIHRQKLSANQELFRTLLHELMTAKTRVHDLEIAA